MQTRKPGISLDGMREATVLLRWTSEDEDDLPAVCRVGGELPARRAEV